MSTLRTISLRLALLSSFVAACTADGDGGPTVEGTTIAETDTTIDPTSTSSSTGIASSSSSSSGADTSSSSSGALESSTSGGPAPEGPPVCQRECELPSSCCGPNEPDCPSAIYPNNYGCVDSVCVPPACSSDEECENTFPGTTCHRIYGNPQCVLICDDDPTVCDADQRACLGQTDDGQSFCRETCGEGGTVTCFVTECDEATGLCVCDGTCPTGETCAPL